MSNSETATSTPSVSSEKQSNIELHLEKLMVRKLK